MNGIFGLIARQPQEDLAGALRAMALPLKQVDWSRISEFVDTGERIGLGRVCHGVLNTEQHPTASADGRVLLAMVGELYGFRPGTDADFVQRAQSAHLADEQTVLAAYEQFGPRFVERLDGAFIVALVDIAQARVVIANDRLGLYPTYIAHDRHGIYFSCAVKSVLQGLEATPAIRDDAIAEYVRFQRLLGNKTFFAGVDQLLPASLVTINLHDGRWQIEQYWDSGTESPASIPTTFSEAVEEGAPLYRHAVQKLVRSPHRYGVYLSGGHDSRAIVGFLPPMEYKVHTFTFGTPGSSDQEYARRIADVAGTIHHPFFVRDGDWILKNLALHMHATEGFHSWVHMHGINMLPCVRQNVDVNLSGLGDMLWPQDSWMPRYLMEPVDDLAFTTNMFHSYNQIYSWPGVTEAEESSLYTDQYKARMSGLAYASFAAEVGRFAHLPLHRRLTSMNLLNHVVRHLLYHGVFGRVFVEYRFPYADIDLLNFCHALPVALGVNRSLQKAIIRREMPKIANIPLTDDDLPVAPSPFTDYRYRAQRVAQRVAHKLAPNQFPLGHKFHMGYEHWLRTDLWQWAETTLLARQTLERGYFREDALRSLLQRVKQGYQTEMVGKVSHLITLELMFRHLVDSPSINYSGTSYS